MTANGRWACIWSLAAVLLASGCQYAQRSSPTTPHFDRNADWMVVRDVPLVRQQARADCGAAAVEMVMRYFRPGQPADVRRALGPIDDQRGVEAGRLRAAARSQGLETFLIEGKLEDLNHEVKEQRPVIVGLIEVNGRRAFGHYVVVAGVNPHEQKLLTADPERGWREVSLREFLPAWQAARHVTLVFPDRRSASVVAAQPGAL